MASFRHRKKAVNMQFLVSFFLLLSHIITRASSDSQTANWLDENNSPHAKGLILSGWGIAPRSRNPWQGYVAEAGNYKRSGKDSSALCTSGKNKRDGLLLRRLRQDEGDSLFFKEEENGVVEADVMLIPWMRPLPEDFAKTAGDSEIVDTVGFAGSGVMPVKRGWEGVTTCGCCSLGQMSTCCRWCRGNANQSNVRKALSSKKQHKATTKKHVKSFIQSTMCMCCYRAQIDVCCSLCKTGIGKVTCC